MNMSAMSDGSKPHELRRYKVASLHCTLPAHVPGLCVLRLCGKVLGIRVNSRSFADQASTDNFFDLTFLTQFCFVSIHNTFGKSFLKLRKVSAPFLCALRFSAVSSGYPTWLRLRGVLSFCPAMILPVFAVPVC